MQLLGMWGAEIVDVAQLVRGKPDRVHDKRIAIFIMADGFTKPGWFDCRRVFIGEEDAADYVIALPDHPHLVRHLDKIERRPRVLAACPLEFHRLAALPECATRDEVGGGTAIMPALARAPKRFHRAVT